jgi:outer membrane protein
MMRISIALIAFVVGLATSAQDQEIGGDQLFGISYDIAIPSGDLGEFIEKTSFRGVSFDYQYFVSRNFTVGGRLGWNIFKEVVDRETYEFGPEQGFNTSGAITAKLWKYAHVLPIQVTGRYYYTPVVGSPGRIFGGLGLGTSFTNQEVWIGQTSFISDGWYFSFYPEFGFDFNLRGNAHFQVVSQYNNATNGYFGNSRLEYWSIKTGFHWRL